MDTLRQLDGPELARAIDRLENPIPGGRVEAAEFGIDVTLLIEQIKLITA